jgi:hypothetical protein
LYSKLPSVSIVITYKLERFAFVYLNYNLSALK